MRIDGLVLSEQSVISNPVIQSGATLPATASTGELFYLSQAVSSPFAVAAGLIVFNGTSWRNIVVGDGASGVSAITLDWTGTLGGTPNYWQSSPTNPSSAVINVQLPNILVSTNPDVTVAGTWNQADVSAKGLVTRGFNRNYWNLDFDAVTTKFLSIPTPTANAHAATKKYVDDSVATGLPNIGTPDANYIVVSTDAQGRVTSGLKTVALSTSGDVIGSFSASSPTLTLNTITTAGTHTRITFNSKGLVTGGNTPSTLAGYGITDALPLSGGTLTGNLILNAAPTADLQAATKKYVDDKANQVASSGNHQTLANLQGGIGGGSPEYYHLTSAEHAGAQAMNTAWTANTSAFLTPAQSTVLSTISSGNGFVASHNGTVTATLLQEFLGNQDITFSFGTKTFFDNVGSGQPISLPATRLVLRGAINNSAVVINGLNLVDPYAQVASTQVNPTLVFARNGTDSVTLSSNSSGTLNVNGSVDSTGSFISPACTITAGTFTTVSVSSAMNAQAGTVLNTPTANTHLANKKYVDDAISTALSGGLGHNSLTGLQGGAATEYYHLTLAQYNAVETIRPNAAVLARRDVNNSFTASQSFGNFRLQAVADPQVGTDGATKAYVDARELAVRTSRVFVNNTATGAVTINWALYDEARLTLTGDISLTFTGALDGQRCMLKVKQDATGNRLVTLPGTVRFSTDAPSYTASTAGAVFDRLGFLYDATDSRYDFIAVSRGYA